MITKSLHTITAATKVAEHLLQEKPQTYKSATALAYAALGVLGHGPGSDTSDPTWLRIVANCKQLLAGGGK